MRRPRVPKSGRTGREAEGGAGARTGLPAPPAWMRWLPVLYVAGVLLLEPVTPVEWPVSFVLIALPLVTAFAHGPVAVAGATVFGVFMEGILAGTPCCAGRPVGYLWERYYVAAYFCTGLVGVLGTILAAHRIRRERTLADVRFVADIAQRVLLRPVPHRIGDLLLESLYLAAAAEARIGGDLYEAVPTPYGVRLLIGDVRGKGLLAVETAAALLGAFREAAHDEPALPDLADRVETSMTRRATQLGGYEAGERFVTAVFVEVPAGAKLIRVVNCGHPPPVLIRSGEVRELDSGRSAPPLNLGILLGEPYHVDTYAFRPGDQLLLYTDGISETRGPGGSFYPLLQRLRSWRSLPSQGLLERLHHDLMDYSGDRLQDDIAALAVWRPADGVAVPPPSPAG
ncbi:PP2C family protein-serine/threonine phosphatase [Streptomyces echinatus]|uniref:Serine phosphatase RsbU (Regulator of sigma subunit) n=1 Tax=Streptomyces echinatus TaxID=67293 RepID=A0A7W9Q2P5_9ACTN|nr:PP2C family protein-serine/threonine phosphatase [Streptomyces echinatus]MBB5932435.1 serine phosphatase RsbU (regulator of sigma subunit) [Streptomyces echinatus]